MIAKLTGVLDSIENDGLILDVHGVGYWVKVSQKVVQQLPEPQQNITLWIEQVVRQEETHLCGFLSKTDRLCFRQLLNVQGVGVRVALAILSVLSPDELMVAITTQDKLLLTKADGVGPKLASRIVLELKDRLSAPNVNLNLESSSPQSSAQSQAYNDALLGLVNLGYGRSEAYLAIQKVLSEDNRQTLSASDVLRLSLKSLAKI